MTGDVPLVRALGWAGMGVALGVVLGFVVAATLVDWLGKHVK